MKILDRLRYEVPTDFIQQHGAPECIVALLCFGYVKFDELDDEMREQVTTYIQQNNVKVNRFSLPFLCREIKERVFTFLLCLNRLKYEGVDSNLKWMFLDYIWSGIYSGH